MCGHMIIKLKNLQGILENDMLACFTFLHMIPNGYLASTHWVSQEKN